MLFSYYNIVPVTSKGIKVSASRKITLITMNDTGLKIPVVTAFNSALAQGAWADVSEKIS